MRVAHTAHCGFTANSEIGGLLCWVPVQWKDKTEQPGIEVLIKDQNLLFKTIIYNH